MIVSATAQSAFRILYLDEDVKKAVDAPRLHNQFLPHVTEYEQTFPDV
jgi:gamma-glutamyltranspeptidase